MRGLAQAGAVVIRAAYGAGAVRYCLRSFLEALMRRQARIDANQPEIVAKLRACGYSVQPLHTVGGGCPDIVVGFARTYNILLEIKDGDKSPSRRALTPDEKEWHAVWRGQVATVSSFAEAVAAIEEYARMMLPPKKRRAA
jgi:hypothetical protein